jgi:hypothetical protein
MLQEYQAKLLGINRHIIVHALDGIHQVCSEEQLHYPHNYSNILSQFYQEFDMTVTRMMSESF